MALQQLPLQYVVDTDEDLEGRLCSKGLKVLEVYSDWCGPCRSVLPTFKRLRLERDDESTLLFLTACAEKIEYLDVVNEHRGKSEPLFLLYRNGNLKQKIAGANTPTLVQFIYELTPMSADLDDLEENPLYLAKKEREKGNKGDSNSSGADKKKKKR